MSGLYGDIYMGRASKSITNTFIKLVHADMAKYYNKKSIIIDGSVGTSIIERIFVEPFKLSWLCFLYPSNKQRYEDRMYERLKYDMANKKYTLNETSDIINEYKKNGIQSTIIKKFIRETAAAWTLKGRNALERFKPWKKITLRILV